MKFTPKTEEEIEREGLWDAGVYDFEVLAEGKLFGKDEETKDTQSKKGNDMIQLLVRVYDEQGRTQTLPDYLLESMLYKVLHFADATGLTDRYEAGDLNANDCIGKTGRCKLGIEKSENASYSDKNKILDYVKRSDSPHSSARAPAGYREQAPLDDGIPDFVTAN